MNDLVSIIIPVHNVRSYIIQTIESVRAQSYTNWELILTEDCSTDGTRELLRQYLEELQDDRIRVIWLDENVGAAAARNLAVEISQGRFIAYLDADDLWGRDKLLHQLRFMRETGAAFCFTNYEFADENGKGTGKVVHVPETLTYNRALRNTTIFTSTVMLDTEQIGRNKIRMPDIRSEDTALWWQLLRAGYTAYGFRETLVLYRRPAKSLSSNKLSAVKRIWDLYRKAEKLGVLYSCYNFFFWAFRAVRRRV
ncbi:MAG: glycosyltransferase [Lachnospiraceae bacterium]|nr:glycosyltransferase [Lachnospiraceae bacterium]